MTDVKMARVQLLEKGSDADDLLREMSATSRSDSWDSPSRACAARPAASAKTGATATASARGRRGRERVNHTRCAFGSCAATATFRGV